MQIPSTMHTFRCRAPPLISRSSTARPLAVHSSRSSAGRTCHCRSQRSKWPLRAKGTDAQATEPRAEESEENGAVGTSGSSVASALADIEAAVQEGTFDASTLEALIPEAISEVEDLLARTKAAEAEKAQAEEQAKANHERYLRLNADFDNFRKRSGAEKEQLTSRTRGDVIKALVPLVDSFEAAQNSVKAETENEQKINAAYQGLYKQMVEAFKSLGVEAVPGVGEPFDPQFHDAIMREPSEDVPDGTVLQEFRRGFRLGSTLLRPGMVKVSFSEASPPESESDNQPPEDLAGEGVSLEP